MVVPSRAEAAALLLDLDPPAWFVRHVAAVAEVAAFVARALQRRGVDVDRGIVEAAALLHDVDKLLPPDDPLRALGHGDAGARWLTERGHAELARSVAGHPVTRLIDGDRFRRWASVATREERVVAYADKRAAQRLMSLDARFDEWQRRYPDGHDLGPARARAHRLEDDICAAAGITASEIRRLPWVARHLAIARGRR